MLFQSSLRRELARSFGATAVVLVTIVMTIVLIRTLGQASKGSINPQDVLLFMAYSALGRLPTILTLALFISMVSALSRMYRDSEMVVWFTSGQSLLSFLAPMFRFAWPVLLAVALSSLFVWPWANQQTNEMQIRYQQRGDLDRVAPGQFQESSNGTRVFFIDRDSSAQKDSANVFIASTEKTKKSVVTAQSGRVERRDGVQFLLLSNGQRLESSVDQPDLKISEFEEYGTRTGDATGLGENVTQAKLMSTRNLLKNLTKGNLSEFAWRVGLALSAINFVVLAVALSSVNPRGGRSGNMLFVLLLFVVYNNLLNLGQSWIALEIVSFPVFVVVLHGGVLLLATAWLSKRHYNWKLWRRSPNVPYLPPDHRSTGATP